MMSAGVRAQSRQSRGVSGVRSVTAEMTMSTTMLAPVTIRILQWPQDFMSGSIGNTANDRSHIFSVGGASDFAIDVSVPDHAELRSHDANIGSIELTGIHNTTPERVVGPGALARYSGDLRFGLLATPPTISDDPSMNEHGSYEGSCKVTVNYN